MISGKLAWFFKLPKAPRTNFEKVVMKQPLMIASILSHGVHLGQVLATQRDHIAQEINLQGPLGRQDVRIINSYPSKVKSTKDAKSRLYSLKNLKSLKSLKSPCTHIPPPPPRLPKLTRACAYSSYHLNRLLLRRHDTFLHTHTHTHAHTHTHEHALNDRHSQRVSKSLVQMQVDSIIHVRVNGLGFRV